MIENKIATTQLFCIIWINCIHKTLNSNHFFIRTFCLLEPYNLEPYNIIGYYHNCSQSKVKFSKGHSESKLVFYIILWYNKGAKKSGCKSLFLLYHNCKQVRYI